MTMQKIQKLEGLFDRFGFSEEYKLGFAFFLGGSILVGKPQETVQHMQAVQKILPSVDINAEFEEILGPLRDQWIQKYFEELVWRSASDLTPRQIHHPSLSAPVSEFKFENHYLLASDDQKIEKMGSNSRAIRRVFEGVGSELKSNHYSFEKSFKAGICFFNLKLHIDTDSVIGIIKLIRYCFDPLTSSIEVCARSLDYSVEHYLNIQIPLLHVLQSMDGEFARVAWAYQSWVLFRGGAEITDSETVPIFEFAARCQRAAIGFIREHLDAIVLTAQKDLHESSFPWVLPGVDNRQEMIEKIHDLWGYPISDTNPDDTTSRAVMIYAYFCAMCETAHHAAMRRSMN